MHMHPSHFALLALPALALTLACGGGGGGTADGNLPTTVTIAGNAGVAGAVLSYTDGTAKTATADGSGVYTFTVAYNWSGAVTPSLSGYSFTPGSKTYTSLTAAQAAQNYTASSAPRTVSGTSIHTYLPFNATTGVVTLDPVPNQWSPYIAAIPPSGSEIPATYNVASGGYSIPNVPAGYYWLRFESDRIWTNQSSVDLGWKVAGRKDVTYPTMPTSVVFNTTGLNPWQGWDYLCFQDWNSNLWSEPEWDAYAGFPSVGDTSLNTLTVDWSNTPDGTLPLVDTTKGDAPTLVQMVDSLLGSDHVQIAKKIYRPTSLVIGDGTGATVSGSFADLPQTASVRLNFARTEFTAYRSQYNPSTEVLAPRLGVQDQPGAATHGIWSFTPSQDILYFMGSSSTVTPNLDVEVSVPALFAGHQRTIQASDHFRMYYQLPGTSSNSVISGRLRTVSLTLPDVTHPIRPVISPAKSPMINGVSLFSNRTGVGVTPTLAWTASELGTAQGYVLSVYRLFVNGTATNYARVARLYLGGNQLSTQLPAGILASGETYFIQLRVYADNSWDPTIAPWGGKTSTWGYADSFSGMITP